MLLLFGALWLGSFMPRTLLELTGPNFPRVEHALITWARQATMDSTLLIPPNSTWLWVYFDSTWSGYPEPLPRWYRESLQARPLDEFRAMYINYALLFPDDPFYTDDNAALREELLLLRRFDVYPEADWLGMPMEVYSLRPITMPANVRFGDTLTFLGVHEAQPPIFARGETLQVLPYWRVSAPLPKPYQVYLHLVSAQERTPLAQTDLPLGTNSYPATAWQANDNAIIGSTLTLTLPTDLPAGAYRVLLGVYALDDFARLTQPDGADYHTLYTFTLD